MELTKCITDSVTNGPTKKVAVIKGLTKILGNELSVQETKK